MALTSTEEAQIRALISQQAALLSLAGNETTITSKLSATKVNLSGIAAASSVSDSDITLIRQGSTDKSATRLALLTGASGSTASQFDNSTKLATTEFVKKSGFQYSQVISPSSGPLALDASYCGKLIDLASSYSGAMTLPPATGLVDGSVIQIWSGSNSTFQVQRSGSDVIYVNNSTVTSISVQTGDTIALVRFGANAWVAISGSAQLKYSASFGSSQAISGFQKYPGGMIVQWGGITATTAGAAVTFPMAFPNACFRISPSTVGGSSVIAVSSTVPTTSGATIYSASTTVPTTYIAIGN